MTKYYLTIPSENTIALPFKGLFKVKNLQTNEYVLFYTNIHLTTTPIDSMIFYINDDRFELNNYYSMDIFFDRICWEITSPIHEIFDFAIDFIAKQYSNDNFVIRVIDDQYPNDKKHLLFEFLETKSNTNHFELSNEDLMYIKLLE